MKRPVCNTEKDVELTENELPGPTVLKFL